MDDVVNDRSRERELVEQIAGAYSRLVSDEVDRLTRILRRDLDEYLRGLKMEITRAYVPDQELKVMNLPGCDSPYPPTVVDGKCRCVICGRCNE